MANSQSSPARRRRRRTWRNHAWTLHRGDCREVLARLRAESFDACVTDPPYNLGFMGRAWDKQGVAFDPATWAAVLRVLKPGAHLLAFGGSRTHHRIWCAIEDAGFEIRDAIMWVYGQGFPKSLDVSKAIDKAAGVDTTADERWRIADEGHNKRGPRKRRDAILGQVAAHSNEHNPEGIRHLYVPTTPAAKQWAGWHTALKPAFEPIVIARKPLCGTVAENVLRYGTGAMNVDACRIPTNGDATETLLRKGFRPGHVKKDSEYTDRNSSVEFAPPLNEDRFEQAARCDALGRYPANLIHDGSDEVVELFPVNTSTPTGPRAVRRTDRSGNGATKFGVHGHHGPDGVDLGDSGSAARFFYCAKATKQDRGEGNSHTTVKPQALMRYLVKLVAPPKARILDPFAGSGSTLLAARKLGVRITGIELDAAFCRIILRRLQSLAPRP